MTQNDPHVLLERDGAIGYVTLNVPEKRNSFTDPMLDALLGTLEEARSDESLRVIVLNGAGRTFSVGGDLDEFAAGAFHTPEIPVETSARKLRQHMRVSQYLRETPQVTIAAINGACAGAGLSIAAACDLRVATTRSVFRTAFLDAALSGDFGGTWSLTKLLGEARVKELYLLNNKLDSTKARNIGLISWDAEEDEFDARVRELANTLADKAPLALRYIKENLTSYSENFSEALDVEARRHVECGNAEDAMEAASAFLERRAPMFRGK